MDKNTFEDINTEYKIKIKEIIDNISDSEKLNFYYTFITEVERSSWLTFD